MNNRRRRADDFTDSLCSFHKTFNEKYSQTAAEAYSQDSLDTDSIKNTEYRNGKQNCSKNNELCSDSILAGNLFNEPYVPSDVCHSEESYNILYSSKVHPLRDISNIASDATSYMSIKQLDLNKCINLFNNEYLEKKSTEEYSSISYILADIKDNENVDPHHSNKNKILEAQCNLNGNCKRSMSTSNLLEHVAMPNERIRKSRSCIIFNDNSKKDTNQNIKVGKLSLIPIEATTKMNKEVKSIIPLFNGLSLSDSSVSTKNDSFHSATENQKYNSTVSENSKEELNSKELKELLSTLADPPKKEAPNQKHLFKRMSLTFYESPRDFTERLLTIIEESFVNNDSIEFPEVSMCRLTAEIRKMFKFIENETAPEWPPSPGMKEENQETPFSSSRKSRNILSSPRRREKSKSPKLYESNTIRCVKSPKKIYRHMSKSTSTAVNTKSPMCDCNAHDSTSTFESLEAHCNRLYPNENRTATRKNQLQSPLQNMSSIWRAYKNQMASLENSPSARDIREEFKNAVISKSDLTDKSGAVPKTQDLRCRLLAHETYKKTKTKNKSPKQMVRSKHYELIEPDDLENTLIHEIAKKRQRCLDTAKMIAEIDTNSDSTGVQQTNPSIVVDEVSSLTNTDTKLMEMLMSCKKYQDYLEEHKSLLYLLQAGSYKSCSQDKEKVRTKEVNKANVATLQVPPTKKRNKSPSPSRCSFTSNKTVVSKPKLFLTPGKSPSKTLSRTACKEKRTYFPNLMAIPSKCKGTSESPHEQSIYRQIGLNYKNVISPVAMYIRGTDPHLMKNLRPKTDEMLLTPKKKKAMPSAIPQKPQMKFKLSPKQPIKTPAAAEYDGPHKFEYPKVNYKLPSHVRTIKEVENKKVGNRVNELLRSTQDKVVIRHEGRMKTVQTDLEQPEIHYDSAEESVHVEQTARKTCFSRVQK